MPDGFEAYVRVFHPFEGSYGYTRRWSEVGAEEGIQVGPDTEALEFDYLLENGGPFPEEGAIPAHICTTLVESLSAQTRSPDACRFAVWSGCGLLDRPIVPSSAPPSWWERQRERREREKESAALAAVPQLEPHRGTGRGYFLFRGPIAAACSLEPIENWSVSPSFWWPEDRAWTVVTEIDGHSTYVGGTRRASDVLLASPELETIEVTRQARID
jgi:hypothetical protein